MCIQLCLRERGKSYKLNVCATIFFKERKYYMNSLEGNLSPITEVLGGEGGGTDANWVIKFDMFKINIISTENNRKNNFI